MELDQVREPLRRMLQEDESILAAWIFGSVARGTATTMSDIDVAVLRSSPKPKTFDDPALELGDRLARAIGSEVQVVELQGAPDDLIHRVLRDGVLIVDRDRARRVRFEVDSRNRYFDMSPIWRRYRAVVARP